MSALISGVWSGEAIVYGAPQSMGSKRAFVNSKTKRAHVVNVGGKKLKSFQESLRDAMRDSKPEEPILGPVAVGLEIVKARPKSHYGSGKKANTLKDDAPDLCVTTPDADKVLRACLDCGTGIWWRDDNQVCMIESVLKRYAAHGEEEHTTIFARALEVKL
jgi:Holliday junction resolvase RusA-like endonuclease